MKIVIAPDSFKESLSASAVAAALAEGLRLVLPQAEVVIVPMADGGEGTLEALTRVEGARFVSAHVHDALGAPVTARYGILADQRTAIFEVAEVIGLGTIAPESRSPLATSSYGVGEMMRACLHGGLRRVVVGLGGSATVDGGAGMLQALGARFFDAAGVELPAPLTGRDLADIATVELSGLDARLADLAVDIACDVDNPLCGPTGAAAVFGPQKGASPSDVMRLDRDLRRLFNLLEDACGRQVADCAGAGAAGGLGAALLLVLHANLRPGVEVVMAATGLKEAISGALLVVTGEGRVDEQTLFGKAPAGVARLARLLGVPVIAVGGSLMAVERLWQSGLFDAVEAAVSHPCSMPEALRDAHCNLVDAGIRIGMWLKLSFRVHQLL